MLLEKNITIKSDKKNRSNEKGMKPFLKKFLLTIGAILLFCVILFAYIYANASSQLKEMGINASPAEIIAFIFSGIKEDDTGSPTFSISQSLGIDSTPELKKDSSGKYTNILLIGIDTRTTDGGLMNTDTLVVASYNYETKQPVLISIPRDLLAAVPETSEYIKISGIYATSELRSSGSGINNLQTAVEAVTGMEIQYYAMINLEGFVQAIDSIGGITVNVENSFTDYRYPNNYDGRETETVSFNAGEQTMDGATALQFARSRHSLDNGEGSDFARARRQQKVIKAVISKLLSSEVYTDPSKILELITIVQDNVRFSGYSIEDIEAGLALSQDINNSTIYTFVLDPSIAGYTILTDQNVISNGYAIAPMSGVGNYDDLHTYVQQCLTSPAVLSENAYILVYDTGAGYDIAYNKMMEIKNAYPFLGIGYMGTYNNPTSGITVFDQTQGTASTTVQYLGELFQTTNLSKPDNVPWGLYGEDVTVLIGAQ